MVWTLGVGLGAYVLFLMPRTEQPQIFVNASAANNSVVITGQVTYQSRPVNNGTVRISLQAPGEPYVGSVVSPVTKEGGFSTGEILGDPAATKAITVEYVGIANTNNPLHATSTLNLAGPSAQQWWFYVLAIVPALTLAILFTGAPGVIKARLLFIVTYLFTFVSCALPILSVIYVGSRDNLRASMIKWPVGILNARSSEQATPEWLLNVGGNVTLHSSQEKGQADREGSSEQTKAAPPAEIMAADQLQRGRQELKFTTFGAAKAAVPEPKDLVIDGGVVVPIYVLVLAMIGAGINTTRKVPSIQKDFDIKADSSSKSSSAANDPKIDGHTEFARIRTELIETYMYFVAAPFLAIAMYYLLQMTAGNPSDKVLVLVAFATGFMSDAVVGRIIAFGEQILKNTPHAKREPKPPHPPEGTEEQRERHEPAARKEIDKGKVRAAAAGADHSGTS